MAVCIGCRFSMLELESHGGPCGAENETNELMSKMNDYLFYPQLLIQDFVIDCLVYKYHNCDKIITYILDALKHQFL